MVKNIFATAGVAFLLTAGAAEATPITTPPPVLTGTGTGSVTAVYLYALADDASFLSEFTPTVNPHFFSNRVETGFGVSTVGQVQALFPPPQLGPLVFSLTNTSSGITFYTNQTASDGDYHALITTDYTQFGLGALSAPANAAQQTALAPFAGQSITFVGFEDRIGGDYDYNDLIFAFVGTTPNVVGIPEPLTISLFGFGVAAAGLMTYRRRRAQKA